MHFPSSSYESTALPRPPDLPADGEQRPYVGHAHFWERAFSRRQVILTTAAGAGTVAALGAGLFAPGIAVVGAASSAPKPIPETIAPGAPFHVLSPASEEPSTITDFNGFIGATEIQGTGSHDLLFDVDMRFMQGTYIGVDGLVHHGTFGFV